MKIPIFPGEPLSMRVKERKEREEREKRERCREERSKFYQCNSNHVHWAFAWHHRLPSSLVLALAVWLLMSKDTKFTLLMCNGTQTTKDYLRNTNIALLPTIIKYDSFVAREYWFLLLSGIFWHCKVLRNSTKWTWWLFGKWHLAIWCCFGRIYLEKALFSLCCFCCSSAFGV